MVDEKKSTPVPNKHKLLIIITALVGLIVLSVLIILWPRTSCESIFQQTAPSVVANLEIIKNKGAFAVRQERIQELSEGAQKVGLHLKTCCSALEAGKLDAKQFQQCLDRASAYERQIAFVAEQVTEADEARERGATDKVQLKIASIDQAILAAVRETENFDIPTEQAKPPISELASGKGMGTVKTSNGAFQFDRIKGMSMGSGKFTVRQFGAQVDIPLSKIRKILFLKDSSVRIEYIDGHSEDTEIFCYWNTPVTFHSQEKKIYYGDCAALSVVKEIEIFHPY